MLKQTTKYLLENGLESLLIVAAVALGIGVIVSFTSFIELGNSLERESSQELFFRETVLSKISDGLHVLPYSDQRKIYEITNMVAQEVNFTLLDLEQIKREIPDIDFAYVRQRITTSVSKDDVEGLFTVFYVTDDFWPASGIQLVSGNPIPKSDFAEGRPTALLSERVARHLDIQVGGQNPERFHLAGPVSPRYTAIGIFQGIGESYMNPDIIVPLDPASSISEVRLVVENQARMAQVLTSLEAYAKRTWGEGVAIRAPFNWQEFQEGQRGFTRTIIFFASLGLLIAALNIVNLMTARILKRYKDIGIWRTLGATTRQVVQQVFAEVFILVLMGGALGVVLSLGLIALYNDYLRTTLQLDENLFALPPLALAVALLCTISVGTLVALYPALLASRVRIVDALREL